MFFYDKRYEEAYRRFSKLYENGDRSVAVVMPLAWLDLHFANIERAIAVLEDYIKTHPDDLDAIQYLGSLYRDADRPYDYLLNLDHVYRLSPTGKILREREKLYEHFGDTRGRMQALHALIGTESAVIQDYVEYSYLLAGEGKVGEATDVINKMMQRYPLEMVSPKEVGYIVAFLSDHEMKKQAEQIALLYTKIRLDVDAALRLVTILKERKLPQAGLAVLNELPLADQHLPGVIITRAGLYQAKGDYAYAYKYLSKYFDQGKLPPRLDNAFLQLATANEKNAAIYENILKSIDLKKVSEAAIMEVAERAVEKKNPRIGKAMFDNLGRDYLKEHPILAVVIALSSHPSSKEEEKKLRLMHDSQAFSDEQKVQLADIYFAKGYETLSHELLMTVDSLSDISPNTLYEVARLFIDLELVDEGLSLFDEFNGQQLSGDENSIEPWLLLNIAGGNVDEVQHVLEEDNDLDQTALFDLFSLSMEHKLPALSLLIADEALEREDNAEAELLKAIALILNNKEEEGLDLFEALLAKGEDVSDSFIYALSLAAKDNPRFAKELKKQIDAEFAAKNVSEERRRELGFMLMNAGLKSDAVSVFQKLAANKPFQAEDVQTLLYLYEDSGSEEKISWLVENAEQTEGEEKGQWLMQLTYDGRYSEVLDLVSEADLDEPSIAKAYLQAAVDSEDKALIAYAVTTIYPKEERLPELQGLGNIAYGASLYSLAESIYLDVLTKDSTNHDAMRHLAFIAYQRGHYCKALRLFNRFFHEHETDYLVEYIYAELLDFFDYGSAALCHRRLALDLIHGQDEKSIDMELLEAQIYASFYHFREADAIFCRLLNQNPDNRGLRADYVNVLINREAYGAAYKLLKGHVLPHRGSEEKDQESQRYLDLTYVRWLKETNRTIQALAVLCCLQQRYPKDADVFASIADVQFVSGRWREANEALASALYIKPGNEAYLQSMRELWVDHLPFTAGQYEYRKSEEEKKEIFWRLYNRVDLGAYTEAGAWLEKDHLSVKEYRQSSNGEPVPFHGDRDRGWLHLKHTRKKGETVIGYFRFAEQVWGVGFNIEKACGNQIFNLEGDWHMPNWDFTETTIEHGSKDWIGVEWYRRFSKTFEGRIAPSLNRYNLPGIAGAASSWKLDWLFSLKLSERDSLFRYAWENTQISFNYALDKERGITVKEKPAEGGGFFRPIPLNNREVHSFYLYGNKQFNKMLSLEGYFGYNFDAEGQAHKMQPVGGIDMRLGKRDGLHARLIYNHSTDSEETEASVDSILLEIKWPFW